jgi:hypothetical protein
MSRRKMGGRRGVVGALSGVGCAGGMGWGRGVAQAVRRKWGATSSQPG